jgi:adenylate cyclase
LREYYDLAANTILAEGGVVDRFIGDGVMAMFGVFNSREENHAVPAIAAVQAAKRIRDSFDVIVRQWMPRWRGATPKPIPEIGLRCGINSGEALVGNTGSVTRDQFSALGEIVNLAAHFEKAADGTKRQILISQTTQSLVEQAVRVGHVGQISFERDKGLMEKFDAFEVDP